MTERELPPLYDPRFEHDACGVGFVVDMQGRRSHDIVDQALTAVCCLNHRGAAGAEPDTGDGAGILIQPPDAFYRAVVDFELPAAGSYATGIAFVPPDKAGATKDAVAKVLADEGFAVLGWRDVPVDGSRPGASTMYAIGLTSCSSSSRPTTAASRTAGCATSAASTSAGDT